MSTLSPEIAKEIQEEITLILDRKVHEAVKHEEEKRFRQLKWLVAILGVVGLGTFGTLGSQYIDKAIDSRAGNIKDQISLNRVHLLAVKLDLENSFSPEDSREAMNLLRRLSENKGMRQEKDFLSSLIDILKAFAAADQNEQILEIVELFKPELYGSGSAVEVLLNHFGREANGRTTSPITSGANGSNDVVLLNFERLEAIAAGHGLEHLALAYRVLFDHSNQALKESPHMARLLSRADALPIDDKTRFFRLLLLKTRASNWQKRATPNGIEIEARARGVFKTTGPMLSRKYHLDSTLLEKAAKEGLPGEEAMDVGAIIATAKFSPE
jgi:hypothetical protein